MRKLILVYGVVSGLVIILTNTLSIELGIGHAWLGFLVMFIAFSAIFVAVKQHRDLTLGGVMRFQTGFVLGLGITLVASAVYVAVWELYLALTDYAFIDIYFDSILESRRASGASPVELAAIRADTESVRQQYANPLFRIPMSFIEIFPVGFLVTLISALFLKNSNNLAAS